MAAMQNERTPPGFTRAGSHRARCTMRAAIAHLRFGKRSRELEYPRLLAARHDESLTAFLFPTNNEESATHDAFQAAIRNLL